MRNGIKMPSGVRGWRGRVREVYASLEELRSCNEMFGIAKRCGYRSCKKMWEENPMIQGSVVPSDLSRVSK